MAGIADLIAAIPPGTVTVAVRSPLGVAYADPFAPGPSPIADALRWLGTTIEVYPGPPRPEDVNAPSLSQNLAIAGLLLGGGLVYMLTRRRG